MAPVAQPNRAPLSEGGGRWFESSSEHQVRTAIAQGIESRPLLRARSSVRIRVAVPVWGQVSARGGTGVRTALRTQRAQALWGFESLRADQF